jgi:hypothetical protein
VCASRRPRNGFGAALIEIELEQTGKFMKDKALVFITCLAAGALIASPALAKPTKQSEGTVAKRKSPKTTQVTPSYRYHQNVNSRTGNTRYYAGSRYTGTRSYAGRQYSGTTYYTGTPQYRANTYYGGTTYYSGGGGWSYPYGGYSVWPYVGSSYWAPGYSGYSGYPYSYYGSYPSYSYYGSGYGYAGSTIAAVQRRLGELGYYDGAVDGVMGPRTRSAIAAFESRNGLVVDGTISRPLLNRLGLS